MSESCAILSFGFDHRSWRKQPWHMAHGLAMGLKALGHRVILITDAADTPPEVAYKVLRVRALVEQGRITPEALALLYHLRPQQSFLVTGARQLARLKPLPRCTSWSLMLSSPRHSLREWARLPLAELWRERDLLKLPLINSCLPGIFLRRGFRRSGAEGIIYTSAAARARYSRLGLPWGSLLRPQVDPPKPAPAAQPQDSPLITYLGPPLSLRGLDLAIQAFEHAVARGLDARLLLLLRPDVHLERLSRALVRVARSPAAARILCETRMLAPPRLRELLNSSHAFLLPFKVTVSDVPLVVIEAGLTGKPLIVLDTPGVSEVAAAFDGWIARRPGELSRMLEHAVTMPSPDRARGRTTDRDHWTNWSQAVARMTSEDVCVSPWLQPEQRLIGLAGVDGSGKTFLLKELRRELDRAGLRHRYVWSRFRNYTSKPLLALARLTGHNRKSVVNGVKIGVHEFRDARWLVWPFLVLQFVDTALDALIRLRRHSTLIVSDRSILDTLVDLAADTGREAFVFGAYGGLLMRLVPEPRRLVVIERPVELIARDRPDALADPMFFERRRLFQVAAKRFDIPVIANDSDPERAIARVLGIERRQAAISREARSA